MSSMTTLSLWWNPRPTLPSRRPSSCRPLPATSTSAHSLKQEAPVTTWGLPTRAGSGFTSETPPASRASEQRLMSSPTKRYSPCRPSTAITTSSSRCQRCKAPSTSWSRSNAMVPARPSGRARCSLTPSHRNLRVYPLLAVATRGETASPTSPSSSSPSPPKPPTSTMPASRGWPGPRPFSRQALRRRPSPAVRCV